MPTQNIEITFQSSGATLLSPIGEVGLIANIGPGILYVGDVPSIRFDDPTAVVPFTTGGYFTVDSESEIYGTVAPGNPTVVNVLKGGLNFFQPPSVISGAELLLYTPPAAEGTIFFAAVPTTVTDPFGNVLPAGFNIGVWSAVTGQIMQHFGVDKSGRLFIVGPDNVIRIQINNGSLGVGPDVRFFNDFGAILLVIDPTSGGTFQYTDTGSATQGVLIGAQVSKNTTDPVFGNPVNAGVKIADPVFGDFITLVGATIAMGIGVLFSRTTNIQPVQAPSNSQRPYLQIDAPEQTTASHLQLQIGGASPDGTIPAGIIEGIVAGSASLTRQTKATHEIQGSLALGGITAPGQPPAGNAILFADVNGIFKLLTGLAGDTNIYTIGEAEFFLVNTFTINAITLQPIFTVPVGIATYEVDVWLVTSNTVAAGAADYEFSGPAATAPALIEFESTTTGTAVDGYAASNTYTTVFTGQGVAGNQRVRIKMVVAFTAAGSLVFNGKEHVGGDTIAVFGGSKLKIKRIA